jgi:hypothetical protein
MPTGLNAQIGYAVEVTPGTFVTPARFLEFVPPLGIRPVPTQRKSNAIRANRTMAHAMAVGPSTVEGPVRHELVAESLGTLLKAMVEATPVTTGSNPYTHVFDWSTDMASISAQVGLPSTASVHPMSYAGLRVQRWRLNVAPGDVFPTLDIDWIGKSADIDGTPALSTATYATFTRFAFTHATFTIAGSEVCVDNISLEGTTGYSSEHKICSTDAGTPTLFRADKASVTGSVVTDLVGLTQLGRLIAGTNTALTVVFNAGASAQLTFAGNVFYTGEAATIQNPGKTKETVAFEFLSGTSDAAALTVTLINSDATA